MLHPYFSVFKCGHFQPHYSSFCIEPPLALTAVGVLTVTGFELWISGLGSDRSMNCATTTLKSIYKNMGQSRTSFCLLLTFSHHNSNINWKSIVVLANQTQGFRIVGKDRSTELWWPPLKVLIGGRHSSVVSSTSTMLRPWVRFPSTPSTLFFNLCWNWNCTCYWNEKKAKNKRKIGRDWPILKI